MLQTPPRPYTVDEVMVGLADIFRRHCQYDGVISPKTLLADVLAEVAHDFWLLELHYLIEVLFGCEIDFQEWVEFTIDGCQDHESWRSQHAPHLTFERVAEFIAQRTKAVNLQPASVFARPCRGAGLFLGIKELVFQIKPGVRDFAPSTPIRSRLSGGPLLLLLHRLRVATAGRLADTPDPMGDRAPWRRTADLLTLICVPFVVLATFLISWIFHEWLPEGLASVVATGFVTLSCIATWMFWLELCGCFANPLPKGVRTFRQLCTYVVELDRDPIE